MQRFLSPAQPKPTATTTGEGSEEKPTRAQAPAPGCSDYELWADKYAPQSYDDLVGLTTMISKLEEWLRAWDGIHLHHTVQKQTGSLYPKAVLLSGPPGIGKTTSARLVAAKLGRDVFELNASDARSKKLVEEKLQDVVQASVMGFGKTKKGRVVIMDEVDGMSSSDRGGVQELIKLIKTTKCPIICICNDHGKTSVRSLAGHCLDLKFQRPQVVSVMKRMREVCRKERITIDDQALEGVIKSSGNDIRQVFNALQMFHHSPSNTSLTLSQINKDAIHRLSGFDACKYIFCESHTSSLDKRNEAFFADYDLIPLMIGQHYVSAVQNSPYVRDELAKMEALTLAADAVLDADALAKMVRSDQRWDLLTSMAVMNLRVGYLAHGSIGFPSFPEWLGKNSNAAKRARMLAELCLHLKQSTGTMDKTSIRLDYVSALRQLLLLPLSKGHTTEVLDLMDEYGMSRDDLFETLSELQFPESAQFRDLFKTLTSNQKASFTREYNKRSHSSQMLVAEEQAVMSRGKKRPRPVEEEEDDDEGEDEEDGEENMDAFRAKKKSATKPKAASAAKPKPTTTTTKPRAATTSKKPKH
ncbi:hypothetical protein BASA81_015300 [Batrachochytrium salamandrivorans]|nr:hypothetical protein BASA81_015300 [Batrachochytrium salamandrivorans]